MAGDEKWICYENPKRKKKWLDPGQPSISTLKRNSHGQKVLLCIWRDQKGVLCYELLKSGETIIAERYSRRLYHLG